MPPTSSAVESAVARSLNKLLDGDGDRKLLVNDANERSISHRLAMYLEQEVEAFEMDYDVDVEYNRVTKENGATVDSKKRVRYDKLPDECQGRKIEVDDTNAQTVFPDIVVHKRGSSDHNLLVIEIKKTSSSDSGKCDKEKIKRFRADIGYENGLFLRLKVGDDPDIDDCDWFTE
ncbi:hypothetical protein [Haloarchaeobius amylolyticus]|uniref:hypothetical protein n=1 Tax=Haloarchaeobius amylolyticus TaxID=1198296 RepID=UPI00227229C9|nr:hypothetical protein [Haloarchaeobius amylolyticus]